MSRKKRKQYTFSKKVENKRIKQGYSIYKKMFIRQQRKLEKKGLEMADNRMLTLREYTMNRKALIEDLRKHKKALSNINEKLVDMQSYAHSRELAKALKQVAQEQGFTWKDETLQAIRTGKSINLSEINENLKLQYPEWTALERANYISQEVFGSD